MLRTGYEGTKKQNATREIRATKKNTKRIKNKIIPRWGTVQMTQAERTRTIKDVLGESSRWLLHRRRDPKKIKHIPGCRENMKRKKRKTKNEKRKVGSKAQKQASKKIVLKASP